METTYDDKPPAALMRFCSRLLSGADPNTTSERQADGSRRGTTAKQREAAPREIDALLVSRKLAYFA